VSQSPSHDQEILSLNQSLLEAALGGDWNRYSALCSPTLSCFEAESNGMLVEGLAFHRFYFPSEVQAQEQAHEPAFVVTMARPHLRWLSSDAVVLSYTRLVQRMHGGEAVTSSCPETRIWERENGNWKLVHVHRS